MSKTPLVSIVIASAGRSESLAACLKSVKRWTAPFYEIVIVSPPRPDAEIYTLSSEYPISWIFEQEMRGCVHAYNLGFAASQGKFICHLNDDIEVCPKWMTEMLKLVGDRDVQGAFYLKEPDTDGFVVNKIFDRLYGNFSLVKRSLAEQVGFWDESFVHYGADPDFSLKLWNAGYEVVATPKACVIHHCVQDEIRKEHLREDASNHLVEKWQGVFWP